MALSSVNFAAQEQTNRVILASAGLVKVASLDSGILGVVSAVGVAAGTAVNWSLQGNPGAQISISAQAGDPTKADIHFSTVTPRTDPYLLVVQASTADGTTVAIPLAVLVREPLSLAEVSHLPAGSSLTIAGNTYDDTLLPLAFQGFGPGGVATGVNFIPPTDLPDGLVFSVGEDSTAYLTPAERTLQNPAGGIATDAVSATVVIRAFRANSLYDTPENAAEMHVTYDLSAGPKTATPVLSLGASFDPTARGIGVDAILVFPGGKAPQHTLEWSLSNGAIGDWVVAPGSSTLTAMWKPSGQTTQDVSITVTVKGSGGSVLTSATAGPFKVSGKDPLSPTQADNWTATSAVPVKLTPSRQYPQDAGKQVRFRVSLPDLVTNESASVTTQVTAVGNAGSISDVPQAVTVLSTANSTVLAFTLPADAKPGQMWDVLVAVSVTGGATPRSGSAKLVAVSNGPTLLVVTPATNSLSGGTGSTCTPCTLRAHEWVQKTIPTDPSDAFLSATPSLENSDLREVSGVAFRVTGAPAGIAPAYNSGSSVTQLTGLIRDVGTKAFHVVAAKTGYLTGRTSQPISLTGTQSVSRVAFTSFSSTNPKVIPAQGFTLTWSLTGSGTITLQKGNTLPAEDVTGSLSDAQDAITASTAYVLRGSNTLGDAFSSPLLVQLGSSGSATQLPPSPTVAVIDDKNHCYVAWEPLTILGGTAPYAYWRIRFLDGTATKSMKTTGLESGFGGTDRSRAYEFDAVAPGYHEIGMQAFASVVPGQTILDSSPWDTDKAFPGIRTLSADKDTASKGEAIAFTLSPCDSQTGPEGDRWKATYSDGSSTEWFPVSITTVAKAFATPGEHTITVVVESDYGTALPAVKLHRSVTKKVFIQDQDYQGEDGLFDVSDATVGLGGEAGFDITTNVQNNAVLQPYLVMVPAVVRDTVTNELKLMVATARGRDASSLLGTMAIDVFPLAGRPHTLDLIQVPGSVMSADSTTYELIKVSTDTLPDWVVGQTREPIQLQAVNGKAPYKWFAQGLPTGLTMNVDGTIVGTVMTLGKFTVNVSVQDSQIPASLDEKTYTLVAKSDLGILTPTSGSAAPPDASVATAYSFPLVGQRGVLPHTWDLAAGSLPEGMTLNPDGTITGWPTTVNSESDFSTPYTFVAQVTDAVGARASRQFSMNLAPQDLRIGNPDQTTLILGQQFKIRIPITGGRPGYTLISAAPSLSGFLKGSAQIVNGMVEMLMSESFTTIDGSVNLLVSVRDSAGTEVTKNVTLGVVAGTSLPRWIRASLDSWVDDPVGRAVTVALGGEINGISYETLDVVPILGTAAMTQSATAGSVSIQGPVSEATNQEVTFRALVVQGSTRLGKISREYSVMTVTHPTTSTRRCKVKALPARIGESFAMDITAPALNSAPSLVISSTQRVRVAAGSSLPQGLSLNAKDGMVYGVFRSTTNPVQTIFEVVTGDAINATFEVEWTVVGSSLSISGSLPSVDVGQGYSQELTITGAIGAITPVILHGRLPEGLSMAVGSGSSGLPQVTFTGRPLETGYFDLAIRVSDSTGQSGIYRTRLIVNYLPYLAIPAQSIPKITEGFPYSYPVAVTGGKPNYTWALATGSSLPSGISFSSAGVLSGTATVASFDTDLTFNVTDAYGQVVSQSMRVQVGKPDPLVISTTSVPQGLVGSVYIGAQLQAVGGVPAYTWSASALPSGVSLNSATGILSGTPTSAFDQTVTITVKDALNVQATRDIRIVASQASGFRIATDSIPAARVGKVYGGSSTAGAATLRKSTATTPLRVGGNLVSLKLSGKAYQLLLCGCDTPRNLTGVPKSTYTDLTSDPYIFDPDIVVGGSQTGAWSQASWDIVTDDAVSGSLTMSKLNLTDRWFSSAVPISDTEFVLIGGAFMGAAYNTEAWSGSTGRTILDTHNGAGDKITPIVFVKVIPQSGQSPKITLCPGPAIPGASASDQGIHGAAATRLLDGRVLFAGGMNLALSTMSATQLTQVHATGVSGKSVYIMSLATSRQSSSITKVADMPYPLACAKALTLLDGRVLVIGGVVRNGNLITDAAGSTSCLLYNPTTNTWAAGPALPTKEFGLSAVRLSDGRVIYGGSGSFYVLDAAATTWTELVAHSDFAPSIWGGLGALSDGTVIYAQGTDNGILTDKGLFTPDTTIYASWDEVLEAHYLEYSISAVTGNCGTYFLDPGTTGGGTPGCKLAASGGVAPYASWAFSPAIPGMSIDPATGLFQGTPTEGSDALVTFTVNDSTASAAGGPLAASKPLRVTVVDPNAPLWVTTAIPTGYLEKEFSYQLTATDVQGNVLSGNFEVSKFSPWGLPPGITLSSSGVLSGKTSTGWGKKVMFKVTHPSHPTWFAEKELLVSFQCNTRVITTGLAQATVGVPYSQGLMVSGGRYPYTFSVVSGALPDGLSLDPTTGMITGTPSATADKTVTIGFHVTDPNGCGDTTNTTLSIRNVSIAITTTAFTAHQGSPFSGTLKASGGTAPYTWSVGSLPAGWNLDPTAGTITAPGDVTGATSLGGHSVVVGLTDAQGVHSSATVVITVASSSYVFRSGPQVFANAWTSLTDNIPLGCGWDRNYFPGFQEVSGSFHKGSPWTIVVDGPFETTTPTLNLGSTQWTATLASITATRAIFNVIPGAGTLPNPMSVVPVLSDGASVVKGPTFISIRKEQTADDFAPNEHFADANGVVIAQSTYNDSSSGLTS